ncbi:hypothetical protein PIB30_062385 [Stylosanthes scabra]|uniref:Aminotransferase-like plant mobile domain-containing protein n=1 Tax=Stylosanthes scabra TaxID=79078 RepID=A0ABU6XLG3_9FABA|nr:hypothetical protein [Stylosanthes scabra]
MIEDILGARPPLRGRQERVCRCEAYMAEGSSSTDSRIGLVYVLRQFARRYILLMIGCWLISDKSNNMVSVRWIPLLEDFDAYKKLSWGSAAADRDTTDIAGCAPLIMLWIYQRFPRWCPEARDVIVFPLVARLSGYQ